MKNEQFFDVKDIDLLHKFIDLLIEQNKRDKLFCNEIFITMDDEESIIVQWNQVDWDNKDEFGRFKFVNSDEVIMKEFTLPDGTIEHATNEEEVKMILENYNKNSEV